MSRVPLEVRRVSRQHTLSDEMTQTILGYSVYSGTESAIIEEIATGVLRRDRTRSLACLNPHSYVLALDDHEFREALRTCDWLIPDGAGIVFASRILSRSVQERVSGPDIFAKLHERLNRANGVRVFFLGSTLDTLARMQQRMRLDFPEIEVAGTYSPPFRTEYSAAETDNMIDAINAAEVDLLWIGLAAPKQEKWVRENKARLNVRFIGAVGAAFDFYAGTIKPSPPWFRSHGLEWLPRLLQEPRRLWRRMGISAPIFVWHVLKARIAAGIEGKP